MNGFSSWLPRVLIFPVLAWNLQCALAFLIAPQAYAPGFLLEGTPGAAAVRGMGILFLMWNVPYALALVDPRRLRVSLIEAAVMQGVGFVGETLLLAGLPAGFGLLRASILRFIWFDGAGLLLLLLALAAASRRFSAARA
ncbi:MAG TPA: hypothetical protein VIO36_13080 [Anaerolineaceae bacterium]